MCFLSFDLSMHMACYVVSVVEKYSCWQAGRFSLVLLLEGTGVLEYILVLGRYLVHVQHRELWTLDSGYGTQYTW